MCRYYSRTKKKKVRFLGSFLMLGLGAITKWSNTSTQHWKDAGRVFNNLCRKLPLQWFWRYAILVAQETRRDWRLTFERYCKRQHSSLLWGCAGDWVEMVVKCIVGLFWRRIFNMAANSSPRTVPQCTLTTILTQSPVSFFPVVVISFIDCRLKRYIISLEVGSKKMCQRLSLVQRELSMVVSKPVRDVITGFPATIESFRF